MIHALKQLIKRTPLYKPILTARSALRRFAPDPERRRALFDLREWERNGRPPPPPHLFKQRVILEYAKRYKLRVLVETGTFLGDMVEATKKVFDEVYSIELSDELYRKAKQRFRDDANVHLIHGDSGRQLGPLLAKLRRPALFWLDGHYSAGITARGEKDTPIFDELEHILGSASAGHVIIIDDARCFGSDPAYPTLDELVSFIRRRLPAVDIEVKDDSIRICPKGRSTNR